jgi:hypothetical protein
MTLVTTLRPMFLRKVLDMKPPKKSGLRKDRAAIPDNEADAALFHAGVTAMNVPTATANE